MTTEGSPLSRQIEVSPFRERVLRQNKTELFFITFKDNTQSTKWITIGKINDWVRRYSDLFYIVRGMEGGIHFHVIAHIPKPKQIRCPRTIHFNCKPINHIKKLPVTRDEALEMAQSKDKAIYFEEKKIKRLKIPDVCIDISRQIKRFWRLKDEKRKRKIKKTDQEKHIDALLDYMDKNHFENPFIENYTTYIIRH